MPAKELDIKTIAAATAGLCLAAGAAAFLTSSSSEEADAVSLAPAPSHLIVIEDDYEIEGVASLDALDPMQYAAVRGIIIEDDSDPVLADASQEMWMEEEEQPRRSMFAAMAGSVGAIDVDTSVPRSAPAAPTFGDSPRPRMDLARPSMSSRAASSDDRLAVMDTGSRKASTSRGTSGSISGARKPTLTPVAVLTPDQIQAAIQQQLPKVRSCYERQLKNDADLRGKMVLSMNVSSSGTVSRARVKGDELGNDDLTACVVREVQGFQFPAGSETIAVEYPVNFKPQF
ncbi:MAG: AgmX/PglI C-terminal domain-containing protein [Proteobacteria bacterium]|nr:AgmX/PglI C-terminal domain-containing protein [Pseudomonadota bacterium]